MTRVPSCERTFTCLQRNGLRAAVEGVSESGEQGVSGLQIDWATSSRGIAGASEGGQAPLENSSSVVDRSPAEVKNAKHLKTASSSPSGKVAVHESTATNQLLQVYLEETNLNSSPEADGQAQVIQTSMKIHSAIVSKPFKAELTEHKKRSVTPIVGAQSHYVALVSSEEGDTEAMGRKNSGKKRPRKNSQGDKDKDGLSKSPPTGLASPEPGSPQDLKEELTDAHRSESLVVATPISLASGDPDTLGGGATSHCRHLVAEESPAEDQGPSRVERRTETAECKRRSMKMSSTEKVFAKKVFVNSDGSVEERLKKGSGKNDGTRQKSEIKM
ncbi:hypothetical protein SKAU_G00196650 [Synaphobranchus kaupii]|uniref:Uncharacterized protein n=1 Tax=Synaphobranchus kaupii TaxID=118154 RepID=A0A9Q1FER3_SYNKA|nr:hypothetical protein SKAU_G00196650 [Synaphobranchus kaupii]